MPGDARKKGGSYSTNPNTVRTRAYQASQTPEQAAARREKFAEYRSLRDNCLRVYKSDDFKAAVTRDARVDILRKSCEQLMANRAAANKVMCGTDVDEYVKRFHDSRWLKRQKAKAAGGADSDSDDDSDSASANGSPAPTAQLQRDLAEQQQTVAQLVRSQAAMTTQLNTISGQVMHLTEVAVQQQARMNDMEAQSQRDRDALRTVLQVLADTVG
ncbi:hypothetical protein COL154_012452 [Colletotrichum chrysophilum]|uniref:uncharacterized protein n=1 Tax=Colletotrichum chrysophilum TaxID=1836956 RepID=UPI0023002CDA|nr:uncharacterized protein COL26b_006375 [Colletotrichum chrysophilum]KAJ0337623.1 hypothetical protein KNSL1_012775 [Colletotrichum chrysophilum]KAJ0352715.1 hypothetical protein COL154_012452 [Colletotrichum chrysophilum]KAJ0375494.1 hypothetical protein COL26b_006375 [Colletotrichum chrysophilum]